MRVWERTFPGDKMRLWEEIKGERKIMKKSECEASLWGVRVKGGSLWEATKSKAFNFHSESQKQWAQFSSNTPTICLQFFVLNHYAAKLQGQASVNREKAKAMTGVRILNINSKQHKQPLIGCLARIVFCSNKNSIFLSKSGSKVVFSRRWC